MTRPSAILVGLCSLVLPVLVQAQEQPAWEIEALTEQGGVEYSFGTNIFVFTNGVVVKRGDSVLTADKVTLNQDSGEALAEGHARVQREDQIWVSEVLRYNFKTHEIEAEEFRTGKSPVFASGEGLHADLTNGVYLATNSYITADDVANPTLKIRAHYLKIIPGKKIVAHHATVYIGNVPVFYFPYYSRDLRPNANHFTFVPGYRSRYGPYLLSTYTWIANEQLDGAVHADYRQRRGGGTGADVNYHLGPWGEGTLKYYYLHDLDPGASGPGTPDNRQRLFFSYDGMPATNLDIKSLVRYQSDTTVLRDFFESEHRLNPQPNTFVEANKFWQNFSLEAYVQPRLNTFFETVERLPDVRLTGYRQQLGETPVYYESQSSAGYYRRRFAETNGPVPGDFEAGRADTFHQLLLPETFFGWLNLTPRVGGRLTYYTQATGEGATTDDLYRGGFNTGAELSFKASRVWPGIRSDFLDLDGVRHIIEPSVNYVYVPTPNHSTNELPQFDYEVPSLRLLPIDFPDYNSIDSIDSQNVIRWGLRNRIQTKRQGVVSDALKWDLYTDWRLRPNGNQKTFADLYSDAVIKPRSWLTLESLVRFDMADENFRMAVHTLTIEPNNVWSWTIGHFYLRDDLQPIPGPGNNLITSTLFYRINEDWGLRATHRYEARDGTMEEQAYTIYRDLRSWTSALTFRLRDIRNGPEDFTVAFTFSLKAHPRYGVGSDVVRPAALLGF